MKIFIVSLLLSLNLHAQNSFTLELGNDLITDARTDRYLTNTFKVKIKKSEVPKLVRLFLPDFEADHFITSIGSDMYTPEDIETFEPDPNDRPYAGHSYVEFKAVKIKDRYISQTLLTVSVVGEASFAKELQETVHDWTDSTTPNGWGTQLDNELGIQIGKLWGYKTELFKSGEIRIDNITYGTVALGNIKTYAALGSKFVAGYNPPDDMDFLDFKNNESKPKWSAYLETELRQTYVARDIFIDGNSAWFGEPTGLDRKDYVTQWDTSVVGRYRNWFLRYTYTYQTEQFVGQNGPTKFGRISLEYRQSTEAIGKAINRIYNRLR